MSERAEVGACVLAAGRSTRMGDRNKLLAPVDGQPMIARVVDRVLAAAVAPVVVVTGHQAEEVVSALGDRSVRVVHNARYAEGLSTSLRIGIEALPGGLGGVLICLGDMPWVQAEDLRRLAAAFVDAGSSSVCVPVHAGRRGNPVLWPAARLDALCSVQGDIGARELLRREEAVVEVAIEHAGVLDDVDTAAALEAGPPSRR